jgi:pimeloyl-ACP methyl ester carboxylesterase
MPFVGAAGVELFYRSFGDGPAMVGIHGTPSSSVLWEDAAERLADLGRCIIYDRRGFGQSAVEGDFTSVDIVTQVEDLVALIDGLIAGHAVLIGRSTGGQIALAVAHSHPDKVRAMVLLEPALFSIDPEAAAWARDLRTKVLAGSAEHPDRASELIIRHALGDEVWETLPADLRSIFDAGASAVLAEMNGNGLDLSEEPFELTLADLERIRLPTLVVSAQDSPESLRRINDRLVVGLANAEMLEVSGGHMIDPAHPGVRDFVSRILGTS